MVRTTGLEPAQPFDHKNLNLTRLPIPPCPHDSDNILSQIQKNANILDMFLQKVASIGVLRRSTSWRNGGLDRRGMTKIQAERRRRGRHGFGRRCQTIERGFRKIFLENRNLALSVVKNEV